jgi:hypothetical protein
MALLLLFLYPQLQQLQHSQRQQMRLSLLEFSPMVVQACPLQQQLQQVLLGLEQMLLLLAQDRQQQQQQQL